MITFGTVRQARRRWLRRGFALIVDTFEQEAEAVARDGPDAVDEALWYAPLATIWRGAADDANTYTRQALDAGKGILDIDGAAGEIRRRTIRAARQITAATRDTLLELAAISADVFVDLADQYTEWLGTRALTLADAQAVAATAYGQHATAAAERGLFHEWRTQGDNRVRSTHAAANRQRVPIDQPFNVGGALLRFPADPDGPPAEVINCRCWETYVRPRQRRRV